MRENVSVCGNNKVAGCGQPVQWGTMFGKRHPFNLDGTSHFDTCPVAENFRGGVGVRGDRDTFFRSRWRNQYFNDAVSVDRDGLVLFKLSWQVAYRVASALRYAGGPLCFANWTVGDIMEQCWAAGRDAAGDLVAISVSKAILYRLRDYLGEAAVRESYCVDGLFLVAGTVVSREESWKS